MPASLLKERIGAAVIDLPHYARLLWAERRKAAWVGIHNRNERLLVPQDGPGVLCDWRWTSDLHGVRMFPGLGRDLLEKSLADWPIRFATAMPSTDPPDVSIVIGHRGEERLPHLLTTIASCFAQEDAAFEIVVVEQDSESRLEGRLPAGVRHVQAPPPSPGMPYSRSWAFNVGARSARGRILIFHDNDTSSPARYLSEVIRLAALGFQVIRLQRFVFYLSAETSRFVMENRRLPGRPTFDAVTQNCEGVTIAVEKEAFFAIGGFDEAFVGWGGEDNEFFERCLTLKSAMGMYLPFLHIHHGAQKEKALGSERVATRLLDVRSRVPVGERIAELRSRAFGQRNQLDPPYEPQSPASGVG